MNPGILKKGLERKNYKEFFCLLNYQKYFETLIQLTLEQHGSGWGTDPQKSEIPV